MTNSSCPEPQHHLDVVCKRPRAPVRISDAAEAPARPLRPLSTSTRDRSSNAAVIQADVVHCYAVSVHARASTNRDEPLLRIAEHYLQSALHRVQSKLAEARARVSDQRSTSILSYTRTPVLNNLRHTPTICTYSPLRDPLFPNKLSSCSSGAHLCPQFRNDDPSLCPRAVSSDTQLPNVLFNTPSVLPEWQHLHRSPIAKPQCADSHAPCLMRTSSPAPCISHASSCSDCLPPHLAALYIRCSPAL